MASNSRPSGPSLVGRSRSSTTPTAAAVSVSAACRSRGADEPAGPDSVAACGFSTDAPVGSDHDLLDPFLSLAQLDFAVPLQGGAALVRVDGVLQRAFALLELFYDALKLCKRRLEAHRHDVRRDRRVGHSVAPAITSPELKHTAPAKGKEDRLFQSISRKLAASRVTPP